MTRKTAHSTQLLFFVLCTTFMHSIYASDYSITAAQMNSIPASHIIPQFNDYHPRSLRRSDEYTRESNNRPIIATQFTKNVRMRGSFVIIWSRFDQDINVMGSLEAKKCTFAGIQAQVPFLDLKRCIVKGNMVIECMNERPELNLADCQVTGTITFLGRKGIVRVSPDTIIDGAIINGNKIEMHKTLLYQ